MADDAASESAATPAAENENLLERPLEPPPEPIEASSEHSELAPNEPAPSELSELAPNEPAPSESSEPALSEPAPSELSELAPNEPAPSESSEPAASELSEPALPEPAAPDPFEPAPLPFEPAPLPFEPSEPPTESGEPRREPLSARRDWRTGGGRPRRPMWPWLASLGLCALIAVDVLFMHHAADRSDAPASSASVAAPAANSAAVKGPVPEPLELDDGADVPAPAAPSAAPANAEADETALPAFDEDDVDSEPGPKKPKEPPHFGTVQEAAARSCSTASVDGLSRQIIEQGRCLNPKAFVPLPSRPNLVLSPHVFPYLEASARDRLVKVLDSRKDTTMTINSALRTVAQQYLVWRWSASKRCGVQLATPPGDSNHETGLALDIAEQAVWRNTLEQHDFHWLGQIDRVHFDFKGAKAAPAAAQRATDVLAFQQLWNKNHPNDLISENGRYAAETEQRLKKAPADGFAIGPSCKGRAPRITSNSGKRTP